MWKAVGSWLGIDYRKEASSQQFQHRDGGQPLCRSGLYSINSSNILSRWRMSVARRVAVGEERKEKAVESVTECVSHSVSTSG